MFCPRFAAACRGWPCSAALQGKVVEVIRGDIIIVEDVARSRHTVRLAGIDAPDLKQALARNRARASPTCCSARIAVERRKQDTRTPCRPRRCRAMRHRRTHVTPRWRNWRRAWPWWFRDERREQPLEEHHQGPPILPRARTRRRSPRKPSHHPPARCYPPPSPQFRTAPLPPGSDHVPSPGRGSSPPALPRQLSKSPRRSVRSHAPAIPPHSSFQCPLYGDLPPLSPRSAPPPYRTTRPRRPDRLCPPNVLASSLAWQMKRPDR